MPPIIGFSCEGTCRSWDRTSRTDTQVCNHFILSYKKTNLTIYHAMTIHNPAGFCNFVFFFFVSTCFLFHCFLTCVLHSHFCKLKEIFVHVIIFSSMQSTWLRIYFKHKNLLQWHRSGIIKLYTRPTHPPHPYSNISQENFTFILRKSISTEYQKKIKCVKRGIYQRLSVLSFL